MIGQLMSERQVHVDPIPREARPYQGNRAGVVTRTAAGGIDYAIIVIATLSTYASYDVFVFLLNPRGFQWPTWSFFVFLVIGFFYMVIYLTLAWATTGRTYGARILGVRVVNFRGNKVSWPSAVIRAAFCTVFPVGLYLCIVNRGNRSVQDVVLRTSVIHDWSSHHRAAISPSRPESRDEESTQ